MQSLYPAHFRGTCLIGFNYYCLWSSLKRSKKGSVDNADPHGFLHIQCAHVHAYTQDRQTQTHTQPARSLPLEHFLPHNLTNREATKSKPRWLYRSLNNRERDCKGGKGKSMFLNKHTVVSEGFVFPIHCC